MPVRPQPRVLPLNVQNQNIASDTNDDGAASSTSGHSLHPYAHQMQNGNQNHSSSRLNKSSGLNEIDKHVDRKLWTACKGFSA